MAALPDVMEGDGSLNEFFEKVKLTKFTSPSAGNVLSVKASMSISEACRTLVNHNYLAAPVLDDTIPNDAPLAIRYVGIVDLLAMVNWMMREVDGELSSLESLLTLSKSFNETSILELCNTHRWCPFVPLDAAKKTMCDVLLLLGKYGVHRALVIADDKLVNIITQSAVIQALTANTDIPEFKSVVDKKIEDVVGDMKELYSVNQKQTFGAAFKVMAEKLISGVPVLDDVGHMVGHVSVKDLRNVISNKEHFARLNEVLETSVVFQRSDDDVVCQETDTVGQVMQKLAKSRQHRIYVMNINHAIIGVISLREVLALFVKEPTFSDYRDYFVPKDTTVL